MFLLREGKEKSKWNANTQYVYSKYNISESLNKKSALFNSASGAIAVMDSLNILDQSDDDMIRLVENGFLVPNGVSEYDNYIHRINISDKKKPTFFTIIPTTACNARCFYCYEENYCKQTVDDNTLINIIDYLGNQLDHDADCVLDWYGGEPLLCVKQIDTIVDELKRQGKLVKRWRSSITTNGTLLSQDLVYHIVNDWHLESAHITIDGTEEEHNRRKNIADNNGSAFKRTYNGIYYLLSAGVYVNLRIHIDHNNRYAFSEVLDELSDLFKFEKLHLFPTFLFPPEYNMAANYIKDSEKEDLFYDVFKALLASDYKTTLSELFPFPKGSGCFATKPNTVVIAQDGSIHACVQNFEKTNNVSESVFSNFMYALESCKDCTFLPICLGGCLYNRNLKNTVRTPCVRNRYVVKPLLRILLENDSIAINP